MDLNKQEINNLDELCRFLGTTHKKLDFIRGNKKSLLKKQFLPKKDGGYRVVWIIKDDEYKNILKRIANNLYKSNAFPECVQGFIKNRSIISNASHHLKKKFVFNIDIKRFFDSINADKIVDILIREGFRKKHAKIISELLTVNKILTTGFSTSPVISNIICLDMDQKLLEFSGKHGFEYTRYGDDITISSNKDVPIKKDIAKILSQYGFTVNHKKCKLLKKGGVQYVTGLTVSDDIPRIPRKFKRSIRLEIYYMKKYGKFGHLFYHIVKNSEPKIFFNKIKEFGIDGLIAFINSVEPKFAKFIRKELSKCKHITKRNNIQLTDKN